jgi:hypothetical protein
MSKNINYHKLNPCLSANNRHSYKKFSAILSLIVVLILFLSALFFSQKKTIRFYPIIQSNCSQFKNSTKLDSSNIKSEHKDPNILNTFDTKDSEWLFDLEAKSEWFPEGVIGDNITGYPQNIVPNIVHYVLLDYNQIDFIHYLSFKSVLNVQKPDKVMVHCNCDKVEGNYWNRLKEETEEFENKIVIRTIERTGHIFGVKFAHVWHESDIMRNRVCIFFKNIFFN